MRIFPVSVALLVFCFHSTFSLDNNNRAYLDCDISISCGSTGTSTSVNGREWIGDAQTKPTSWLSIKGASSISTLIQKLIYDDTVPHKTARLSSSQFSYAFHLSPGQKILRLHFNPKPYKGFKKFKDLFTVEAGPFNLLSNFSASRTAQNIGVDSIIKEFCINVEENQTLNIVFLPEISSSHDKTHAFINGIEIISVPQGLTYSSGSDIDNNTALEIIHQVDVRWDSVLSGDKSNMFGMGATVPKYKAKEIKKLTWKRPVDVGFKYLVRIHLSEIGLKIAETSNMIFKILVNEMIVDTNIGIVKEREENGNLKYRDYLVVMEGQNKDRQRDLLISVQPDNEFMDGYEPFKGFEILKLSNTDNSLASPNPFLQVREMPFWTIRNLLSVMDPKNVISTIAVIIIYILSIIVYKLQIVWESNLIEKETKPSARAERHCRRFSLAEIQLATRKFSSGLFLGKGGFGLVFKGKIENGRETVAIKRLKLNSWQGKREFWTEIETLSELRHINLVSLIGYWNRRLNICIGAGRGIDYLHTGHRIIHRDVKSSNILLDENFISKVSDFGLAKPEDRSKLHSHIITRSVGTPGYIDPYYVKFNKLTSKSDIYSFGVVLLEVLCRRRAMDPRVEEDECCLASWAQNKINMGMVDHIVDSSLVGDASADSLKVFVGIAERCLQEEPKKRPTMAQVVLQLELALELQENIKDFIPDQMTNVADETIDRGYSQTVNTELPAAANKERRKTKIYKLWNAISNMGKVDRKKEMVTNFFLDVHNAGAKLPKYDFSSIAAATNQFSDSNKIGKDSFSTTLYKGELPTGRILAVKRINESSWLNENVTEIQRCLDEFKIEIFVTPNLQHRNIIKLLGYCNYREPLLVYEFMESGSLDTHIYDEVQRSLLHWNLRFKIILGIVRGIIYLQDDSGLKIIHRNIKPSNVFLDRHMNPKISEFGLAKSLEDDQYEVETRVAGTIGYIAPECFINGIASFMIDVYSFGILVLEIVSGRRVWEEINNKIIGQYAWELWNEGNIMHLVDVSIKGAFSTEEARRCIEVGLLCIQHESLHRPTISLVHKMLLGEESLM